jgi:hypothetical protein
VLRIRIQDPVLFYPLDPGSEMNFFQIPDLGSRIQGVCFWWDFLKNPCSLIFFTNKTCSWIYKKQEKSWFYFSSLFLCTVGSGIRCFLPPRSATLFTTQKMNCLALDHGPTLCHIALDCSCAMLHSAGSARKISTESSRAMPHSAGSKWHSTGSKGQT